MSRTMENKKKKRRSLIAFLVVILVMAALAALALWLSRSGKLNPDGERATTYNYASDAGTVTCGVGNGLAVASSSGLKVYDRTGMQTVGEMYVAQRPVLTASGGYAAAYDAGGEQVRVFTEKGTVRVLKPDGAVSSARVNGQGWCAVCTEESGYKGAVTVYQDSGAVAYKWLSGEAWVLTAVASEDGKRLAVLTLTDTGSRIVLMRMNREEPLGETVLSGELLLDIGYDGKGDLYGVSADALYRFGSDGGAEEVYRYDDSTLSGFTYEGGPVLALSAHRTGGACRVVALDGKEIREIGTFTDGVTSLAADRNAIAVLSPSGLTVWERKSFEQTASYGEASSGLAVSLTQDGSVIVTARNTAAVYPVKEDGQEE